MKKVEDRLPDPPKLGMHKMNRPSYDNKQYGDEESYVGFVHFELVTPLPAHYPKDKDSYFERRSWMCFANDVGDISYIRRN